jgi:hypothetical protein
VSVLPAAQEGEGAVGIGGRRLMLALALGASPLLACRCGRMGIMKNDLAKLMFELDDVLA